MHGSICSLFPFVAQEQEVSFCGSRARGWPVNLWNHLSGNCLQNAIKNKDQDKQECTVIFQSEEIYPCPSPKSSQSLINIFRTWTDLIDCSNYGVINTTFLCWRQPWNPGFLTEVVSSDNLHWPSQKGEPRWIARVFPGNPQRLAVATKLCSAHHLEAAEEDSYSLCGVVATLSRLYSMLLVCKLLRMACKTSRVFVWWEHSRLKGASHFLQELKVLLVWGCSLSCLPCKVPWVHFPAPCPQLWWQRPVSVALAR